MAFDFWAVTVCRQNTGSHMLDSGDAYGRHWQRPAEEASAPGLRIERDGSYFPVELLPADQLARLRTEGETERDCYFGKRSNVPSIFVPSAFDAKPGDWVSVSAMVSTPHFFDAMLDPDEDLQKAFDEFAAAADPYMSWPNLLSEFTEDRGWRMEIRGNTYNDENDLSQDFQYFQMEDEEGDDVMIIMSHNGCDVRGGYSSPFFARFANYAQDYFWDWCVRFSDEDGRLDLRDHEVFAVVGEDGEFEFRSQEDPEIVVHPYNPVEGY